MSSVQSQPIVTTPPAGVSSNTTSGLTILPAGFPSSINGNSVWTGAGITDEDYIFHLTPNELAEISRAVVAFKRLGLDGSQVNVNTFPLPSLGSKLTELSLDIHDGRGFSVIRGMNPRDYSVEDLTVAYMGVSSYIADKRGRQDKRGNILVHIIATEDNDKHNRHSTESITFHNEEAGDIISWLTRGAAATGGKCVVASSAAVYNLLAAIRPDLIQVLSRGDWPFAIPRYQRRPVLYYEDGRLIMNYGRAALLGSAAHPRNPRLPTLNTQQREALDAVDAIARATEFRFTTRAGDIHFINNLSLIHRRDQFVNDGASQRHLVRMRLRNSTLGWSIPKSLGPEWSDAFEKQSDLEWHIEHVPEHFVPLRKYPN